MGDGGWGMGDGGWGRERTIALRRGLQRRLRVGKLGPRRHRMQPFDALVQEIAHLHEGPPEAQRCAPTG